MDTENANWGYKTGFLFFGTGLVVAALIYLYTPEPAQRNPAEMDEMYQQGVPAWRMKKYVTMVQTQHQSEAAQVLS